MLKALRPILTQPDPTTRIVLIVLLLMQLPSQALQVTCVIDFAAAVDESLPMQRRLALGVSFCNGGRGR